MSAVLQEAPRADLGIFLDLPAEDYHRRELGVVSNSVLKILRERTPAHYKAYIDGTDEREETPTLRFGTAYHMAVLEPERFAATYAVAPKFGDLRTNAAKARRDTWQAENVGKEMLSEDDGERIAGMLAAIKAHPIAGNIFRSRTAHREATMRWVDERTGLTCKLRADLWEPGQYFADLKTTEDASPAKFAKAIHDYGYAVQHAHYCDGANACGERIENYLIVAQEKAAPYCVAVYHVDANTESRGYELRERGMDLMARCLRENRWPAYGDGIEEISLPAWALKD